MAYQFTFAPKDPKHHEPQDLLDIAFQSAGASAAVVTPPASPSATKPAHLEGTGFAESPDDYFAKHPDEGKQLYGWVAAQRGWPCPGRHR